MHNCDVCPKCQIGKTSTVMNSLFPRTYRQWAASAVFVLTLGLFLARPAPASGQQLTCNPCNLAFGNVASGSSKTMTLTVRNGSSRNARITRYNKSAPGFRVSSPSVPLTLAAGHSVTVAIVFEPTSGTTYGGNVRIENSLSTYGLRIGLTGSGGSAGSLSPSPSTVSFGSVPVGSTVSHFATLTNRGGSSVKITNATVTGSGFSISGLSIPLTLNKGQSVTFTTKFHPASAGTASGRIAISSTATNVSINLTGSGTSSGALSVTPTSLAFGTVTVGSQKSLAGSLKASGGAIRVNSASTGSSEFTLSGISFPLNLSAGQSVNYTVKFTPASSGAASANLTFSATGATAVESLSGTGAAASSHSVSLTWNRSTSSSVVGYNVYRGTVSGGPYSKINSALEASTGYSDASVVAGRTYYYVVTAVDGGGTESGYSNQVKAIIPTP